ncbi:LacI family DNA-binding transcriptional regulator [Naumannella cuiyingiana]|uniref:LacI family transcriptional regulator n=1 Tax=Naumannella cuiyingiana TaxID=1347891 RepID=A0A7Z0D9H5_9ACTN|nr:LacI family DNA-binding transcriptional regulator [Naumannella cuiyingiana]NYI71236.1 LacI family transcriptional regulator [Naumannella cuiyingiana]
MGDATKARIGDVARVAGVSVGTVSNVLNRPEIVSAGTRERVHEAIVELGFVPNASARQLREGASRTAGMLVLDIANPFFTEMARGVEDRLIEAGLTMALSSSDADPDRERRVLEQFAQQRLRGVLVTPSRGTGDNLGILLDQGTRVVLLDHRPSGLGLDAVASDDVAGGRIALDHLLGLGHRRIGFLNGSLDIKQCRDRHDGAREAIAAAGGDPDADLVEIEVAAMDAANGYGAMLQLFDDHPELTAVFCVNDLLALGVMRAARERAVSVPADLSVVGYDDVAFAGELAVPLTSVRQPTYRMGAEAAGLLLERGRPRQILFTPELVVRASAAPPG